MAQVHFSECPDLGRAALSLGKGPLGALAGPVDQSNKDRNKERLEMGLSTCLFHTQTHGNTMSSKAQPDVTL